MFEHQIYKTCQLDNWYNHLQMLQMLKILNHLDKQLVKLILEHNMNLQYMINKNLDL